MSCSAGRIEFYSNSRIEDFPTGSKIRDGIDQSRSRPLTVHGDEVSLRTIDALRTGGEACLSQPGCRHAISCGHTGVERFHHASDILFKAACQGCRYSKRIHDGRRIKFEEAGSRRCSSESSNRRCTVPAALVVVMRIHNESEAALYFESNDVCVEYPRA